MDAANALVHAELPKDIGESLHPSIPAARATNFPPLVQAELDRLQAGRGKDGGIDLSRYEALDAPEKDDLAGWQAALQKAYASAEYLRGRQINLGLLETYGKNAWLIGNGQLEDLLRDLERELEMARIELEQVQQERRTAQGNVAGEMQSLEDTWRQGVGRMIEAQAAGERLKQEILDRRRHGAS